MEDTHIKVEAMCLRQRMERALNVKIQSCYQCGKCTAGCPLNVEMDLAPHQILRALQSEYPGYEERVLGSLSIWLCLGCETCYSRCPQEIHLPQFMDFLRQESKRLGLVHPNAKNVLKFHQAFLAEVKRSGRLNELPLTIDYKLRSFHFMQDVQNAPSMLLKGKLGLLPHRVQHTSEIGKLFQKIIG